VTQNILSIAADLSRTVNSHRHIKKTELKTELNNIKGLSRNKKHFYLAREAMTKERGHVCVI
jgi:hypothetical protein